MRVIREKSEVIALNNIVLAFVGDAVYSLKTREKYALSLDAKPSAVSDVCSEIVSAKSQARKVGKLIERGVLTDEEIEIFKRARNTKKANKAKNASVNDYHKSTGFEALLGYLYLTGQDERLDMIAYYEEG